MLSHSFSPSQAGQVSFSNIPAGGQTATFALPRGVYTFGLNAADPNNPGSTTLYDNTLGQNVFVLLASDFNGPMAGPRNTFIVPKDGETYYVTVTTAVQSVVIQQVWT